MRIRKYNAIPQKSKLSWKSVLRSTLIYLYVLFPVSYLFVLIHALFRHRKSYRYEVSLCLIFKNEAPYLREWIEYHHLIGVEHFYLYNNMSDDNYMEVLTPYVEQGIVTLVEWPYQYAQISAYEDCYKKVRNETHWLGYIDADEFVNLQGDNDIKSFLCRYAAYPALYLHWRMFGTSGIVEESENYLVTERHVAAWPFLCDIGKTFINNDYQRFKIGIHQSVAIMGYLPLYPVDDKKFFKPGFINPFSSLFGYKPKVYLNHYWSRSYKFYCYKDFKRGDVACAANEVKKSVPGRFESHELNNSTHDYSIQRWLVLLKNRMIEKGYF